MIKRKPRIITSSLEESNEGFINSSSTASRCAQSDVDVLIMFSCSNSFCVLHKKLPNLVYKNVGLDYLLL